MSRNKKKAGRKRIGNDSLIIMCVLLFSFTSCLLFFVVHIVTIESERYELEEAMGQTNDLDIERTEPVPEEVTTQSLEAIIEDRIPLFYQWDDRWASFTYGSGPMSETGCGPTCLSMVAMYLLKNTDMTPAWMAEFSIDNGFCAPGNGTSWSFMSEGAALLGIYSEEVAPDKDFVRINLEDGNPIICIMGPGIFTDGGHFIVLSGFEDGKIRINDPNSRANSEKLWSYEEIEDQIRNMWVYQV